MTVLGLIFGKEGLRSFYFVLVLTSFFLDLKEQSKIRDSFYEDSGCAEITAFLPDGTNKSKTLKRTMVDKRSTNLGGLLKIMGIILFILSGVFRNYYLIKLF